MQRRLTASVLLPVIENSESARDVEQDFGEEIASPTPEADLQP